MNTTHPHPAVRVHPLAGGWTLHPDGPLPNGRDVGGPDNATGWVQGWTVLGPSGRSASLHHALETHTDSDHGQRIPRAVMVTLSIVADDLFAEGLA